MEEKVEKVLKTVLKVQSSMITKGSNNDIDGAIA
jgi:hypothetical protein